MKGDFRFIVSIARRVGPIILLATAVLGLPLVTIVGKAASPAPVRHIVLLVVDGISLEDLVARELPNIRALMDRGAIGLMNTRTARLPISRDTYITIGAGTRASGPVEAGYALNAWEHWEDSYAADVYRRNMGVSPPGDAVVHPFIAGIVRANSAERYDIVPGLLGKALHDAGLRTAVLGNSDTPGETSRNAVSILMDERGIVDFGNVGAGVVLRGQEFPGGWLTDIQAIASEYRRLRDKAQVVAIETGDTLRLERKLQNVPDILAAAYRAQALAAADELLGAIMPLVDWNTTRIFIITPTPPSAWLKTGGGLTPVVVAGGGIPHGLLLTPTTRRPGIVTNLDIAPTVLSSFGIPVPYPMLGRPMGAQPDRDSLEKLIAADRQINAARLARSPILKTFVTLQVIGFIGSLLFLFVANLGLVRQAVARVSGVMLKRFMLGLCCVPIVLLILPALGPLDLVWSFLLTAGFTVMAAFLFARIGGGGPGPFVLVAIVTCFAVLLDISTGANLMQYSILGYDFVGGARYYGIGNEYAGVVIGAALVGAFMLGEVYRGAGRLTGAVAFLLLVWTVVTLGLPVLGANLGGVLAAFAAFAGAILMFRPSGNPKMRIKLWHLGIVALGAICLLVLLAVLDARLGGGGESHLGKTIGVVTQGGPGELLNIILRKLGMNMRLVRYTIWTKVLLSAIAVLGILCVWPVEGLTRILKRHPGFGRALVGSVVGAVAAFFLNDSGVVAAATLMLFPVAVLLYLAMVS